MVAPQRLLTLLRGAAAAATLAGVALMGQSGLVAAQAGPALPGTAISATAADSGVVDADDDCSCDHDHHHHRHHRHHHHGGTTTSSSSSSGVATTESTVSTESAVSTETLSITSLPPVSSAIAGPPPSSGGAAGVAAARAIRGARQRAPLTGAPATGADIPFGLGLGLTLSGSALLAAARWLRRRSG